MNTIKVISMAVLSGAGVLAQIQIPTHDTINGKPLPPNMAIVTAGGLEVKWQYDKWREEAARVKREEAAADEFNRTNTNPALGGVVVHNFIYQWTPEKGSIELGYRSDGVVIWRELPEGK